MALSLTAGVIATRAQPLGRRLRVLHVIEDLGLGGAERLLATLLPLLPERGIDCELAVLGQRDAFVPHLVDAGVRLHRLGLPSQRQALHALHGLLRVMRAARYDLVHTHLSHANLYGRLAAGACGLPVTTTYHDTDYEPEVLLDNPGLRPWKLALYRTLDRASVLLCPRVIAVSSFVARSLEHRLALPIQRIEVIPNGISASAITQNDAAARATLRAQLGVSAETCVVVHVGRLTPQKGQLHTLAVARRLRDQPVLFILVGEGPTRHRLEREIASEHLDGQVRLVGGRLDVLPFLHAADIFMLPSLHEGFGIAAVEAMAAGLPVVAYRHGPLTEIVLDGQTGLLADFGSTDALAAAVRALLADPPRRARMGEAGRRRALEGFLIAVAADRHARFYRALIDVRAQGGSKELPA
jgi:glycosyltransferase involved in cell wall biosynthesis